MTILGIAGTIVVIGGALGVVDQYRPWAKPHEVEEVRLRGVEAAQANHDRLIRIAEDSYAFQIRIKNEKVQTLQFLIDKCKVDRDCEQRTVSSLISQQEEVKAEVKRLERQAMKATK